MSKRSDIMCKGFKYFTKSALEGMALMQKLGVAEYYYEYTGVLRIPMPKLDYNTMLKLFDNGYSIALCEPINEYGETISTDKITEKEFICKKVAVEDWFA